LLGAENITFLELSRTEPVMRILFSTVKDIGHITPFVPYARHLRELGYEVLVATTVNEGALAVLPKAGLAHSPFDSPAPDELQPS
jgi:hypothetical protein